LKKKLRKINKEIIVIAHNIRSAFNVGSIFRTSDAAGVSRIILGGYCPYPPHPKLLKVSLGAEKTIPYEKCGRIWRKIVDFKKQDYQIIALEKNKEAENIFNFKPKFPLVLILGNEKKGLSPKILKHCDKVLFIPMQGRKESLNVSVAYGIAAYQLTTKLKNNNLKLWGKFKKSASKKN